MKRGNRASNDRMFSPYNKAGSSSRRANSVPTKSASPSNRFNSSFGSNSGTKESKNSFTSSRNTNSAKINPSYQFNYKKSVNNTNNSF